MSERRHLLPDVEDVGLEQFRQAMRQAQLGLAQGVGLRDFIADQAAKQFTQADLDAAVAAERERCAALIEAKMIELQAIQREAVHVWGRRRKARIDGEILGLAVACCAIRNRGQGMQALARHFAESAKYTVEGALSAIRKRGEK